jgi:putative aldouronate transport system permease protein
MVPVAYRTGASTHNRITVVKDLERRLPPSTATDISGTGAVGLAVTEPFSKRGLGVQPNRKSLRWRIRRAYQNNGTPFLMALPGIVLVFIFAYLPMFGVIIAFKEYRFDQGILGSKWVGFYNFEYLFSSDVALRITRNTVLMNFLFMVFGTAASVTVALLMNEIQGKLRARFYQSAMFLPYFISWVIVGYFSFAFLSYDGVANKVLADLRIDPVDWFNSADYWPAILVIVSLWKGIGYSSILYLAVMLGISPEYYDAAKIDGAGKLQQIWYVTLPELMSAIVIVLLLAVGGMLRADFGLFYNVTQNSPSLYPTTDVIDTFVYRALIQMNDMGMSAAAGLYQSAVGFVLVLLANWLVRRIDPERSLF